MRGQFVVHNHLCVSYYTCHMSKLVISYSNCCLRQLNMKYQFVANLIVVNNPTNNTDINPYTSCTIILAVPLY